MRAHARDGVDTTTTTAKFNEDHKTDIVEVDVGSLWFGDITRFKTVLSVIYIYTHIYMYACIYIYIHTQTYIYIYAYMSRKEIV